MGGFPAVSRVSLFETDNETDDSKNDCTLRCVILLVRTAQLIYPIRNGTVRYLAVSTHTLGPIHSGEGGVLAVNVFTVLLLLINTGGDLN